MLFLRPPTSLHTSPHLLRASHCCSSDISVFHQGVPCCSSGLHISGLSLPGESGDHRKLGLPRIAQACQQLGAEPLSPPPSLPWGAFLQEAGGGATCCVCVWARTARASVFSSAMWVPTDMRPQPVPEHDRGAVDRASLSALYKPGMGL